MNPSLPAGKKPRVLCVDDEPEVLAGLESVLRRRFEVATANSGPAGMKLLESQKEFAVVVSDMRMPGMDGATFLTEVREAYPNTVRMLLTGYADIETTVTAVNSGQVFRVLTKPCSPRDLVASISDAAEHHRLVTSERELLEQTVVGAVNALTEVLGIVNPVAFGYATRLRRIARHIATRLPAQDIWQFELAAMFSQIGCVALPGELLDKVGAGQPLSDRERSLYESHIDIALNLLKNIPRLEKVSQMVGLQSALTRDAREVPANMGAIELGAYILSLAVEVDRRLLRGSKLWEVLDDAQLRANYHADFLEALAELPVSSDHIARSIYVSDLRISMIMDEDVCTTAGVVVVRKGQEVTYTVRERLKRFAQGTGIVQPFRVLIPSDTESVLKPVLWR